MFDHWRASQIDLPFAVTRKLVDFSQNAGPELFDSWRRAGLFETSATNAAALIGIQGIFALTQAGVPHGIATRHIHEPLFAGLRLLMSYPEHWLVEGSPEEIEAGRKLLSEGPAQVRMRHVTELFGIHERKASRFLFLDSEHQAFTANDLSEKFKDPRAGDALLKMVDAYVLAMNVHSKCEGALFKLERKKLN